LSRDELVITYVEAKLVDYVGVWCAGVPPLGEKRLAEEISSNHWAVLDLVGIKVFFEFFINLLVPTDEWKYETTV